MLKLKVSGKSHLSLVTDGYSNPGNKIVKFIQDE